MSAKKYKVTLELTTGSVHNYKVFDTPEKLTKVFEMIDTCWKSKDTDGYVCFGGNYVRISHVVRYSFKRRYLW